MFNIRNLLLLALLVTTQLLVAQSDSTKQNHKQYMFTSVNYHSGSVILTNPFVRGENLGGNPITAYQSLSIKFGWQNPGYTDWQKIYRGPYYGVGLFVGNFYNPQEIGYPISAYGFFGIPIFRAGNFELYTELQYGIAWNWTFYDLITNPYNIAIGSGFTVHLDIGLNMFYSVTDKFSIGAGYSFSHFSNGGFERPNRGLNLSGASVELKYSFLDRPDYKNIERPSENLKRFTDLDIMLGYGDHQMVEHELDSNYFSIMGLGLYHSTQFGNAFRCGVGVDFNYLMSLSANPDGTMGDKGSWDNLTVGFLIAPEIVISRLSIVTGIGVYAKHSKYGNFKQSYQRASVKYHFTEDFSFGVGVRSINFMLAEFLEFNMGYRFRWERKW